MSEKENTLKRIVSRLDRGFRDHPDKHKIIGFTTGVIEIELSEKPSELHSLRMAVLEFYNSPTSGKRHDLALSAGIHFENGQWKMKEGK